MTSGFAAIQAAFAATGAAPTPAPVSAPVAPTPAAPAFAPSPFQPTAFVPPVAAPAAPPAFQFVPPANAATPPNGGPWSPINPPGERVALGAPLPKSEPAVAATGTAAIVAPSEAGAPAVQAAEPPKRKRRTKAEMAAAASTPPTVDPAGYSVENELAMTYGVEPPKHVELQPVELSDLPADGSTVEDIVEELFARGVVQVNLMFTKDGMR